MPMSPEARRALDECDEYLKPLQVARPEDRMAVVLQRIWDSRDELRQLDEARLAFEAAARAFGEQIAKINPDFVELWERDTCARTATIESAVTSFVEAVSSNIDDFLDHDYVQRTSEIADMEEGSGG